MHAQLTCPQCQASMKLLEAPRPGKNVVCPQCEIGFTLSESAFTTPASGRPLLWLALVAIGVGVTVGGIVWHQRNKEQEASGQIAQASPKAVEESPQAPTIQPTPKNEVPELPKNDTKPEV